jgi:hypothetical protein
MPPVLRRAASFTRENEWASHPWPTATHSLLQDYIHLETNHSIDEINQPLFSLIKARKAINDAFIACSAARRLNTRNPKVSKRLQSLSRKLSKLHTDFPLSLI